MKQSKRHRLSILWRVTLWYTAFFFLLMILVVTVIYLVSGRIIQRTSKSQLIQAVETAAGEMEYDDGEVDLDDDHDFNNLNIQIAVFNTSNQQVAGYLPKRFPKTSYHPNEIMKASGVNEAWYVYDLQQDLRGYGPVIIRGITLVSQGAGNTQVEIYVLLAVLPILILVATVGGFGIIKRAFRPIARMRETVEQINEGKDLTKRVNLGNGEDEIYKLAHTFDQMFERLEDSFEREQQFTSDASHELRTPISVILSQCEYASEQADANEMKRSLQIIERQTKKMYRLVQQLLMLSRCDQGSEKLKMETMNLSELCEIVAEEAKERAERKKITIKVQIQPDIQFHGDETLILRMFVNLINNAIHYGREQGWIQISLYKKDNVIIGEVEDNGIGIASEDQEKIWDRFYQVNPSRTKDANESMGLGLSMVKWIVQVHNGTIRVESELGKGSRFIFEFR